MVPQGLCTRALGSQATGHLCKSGNLHGAFEDLLLRTGQAEYLRGVGCGAGGKVSWTRAGAWRLTQYTELQVPGISASAAGGFTAIQSSIRGLDSSKVDRALGSLTSQGHPILEPPQLGFWVALSHTVQIKGFSRQHLQDPRARLHLRRNWQGPKDRYQGRLPR